jgi:hypothetical protein
VGPTLLDVIQNTDSSPNECKLGPPSAAEDVNDAIPDTYDDYNPGSKIDQKTNDAFGPISIMKEDDELNHKSDADIVVHSILNEIESTNPPVNSRKHEPLNTSEDAKDVSPDSLDENSITQEAGHVIGDTYSQTSIKKEDESQKDLEKAGILLSDSFLACLEEEFVKIETERAQNGIKIENPLSESIPCQDFENTALVESKIAGLPLKNKLEVLCGPYLHPQPVLSVTLNSKGDSLELCVLCGALNSCERTVYIYNVTSQAKPIFVGYTSMLFLSSEELHVKGNVSFLSIILLSC